MTTEEAIRELRERLDRYPADRYPAQHATARFHLGMAFLEAGRTAEAEEALVEAARLFSPEELPAEHATALNALGALLRETERPEPAARAFERAAAAFERAERTLEEGASRFNLGLVRRELGDLDAARAALEGARELLEPQQAPVQAAAAARELGQTLLADGRVEDARGVLEEARDLAGRSGALIELGATTNLLGLAHLAAEEPSAAAEAFAASAGAHPRSVRPADHAMAKANLAVAHDRAGDAPRARLAAQQALGVPDVPPPVREQAREVLERLGTDPGDLVRVLDEEPHDAWAGLVRSELVRLAETDEETRREAADGWISGQLERRGRGADLAEAWLGAILELPPQAMEAHIRALLRALEGHPPEERDRFRKDTSSGMVRFHVPQWMRLKDTFNRIASELGQEEAWA